MDIIKRTSSVHLPDSTPPGHEHLSSPARLERSKTQVREDEEKKSSFSLTDNESSSSQLSEKKETDNHYSLAYKVDSADVMSLAPEDLPKIWEEDEEDTSKISGFGIKNDSRRGSHLPYVNMYMLHDAKARSFSIAPSQDMMEKRKVESCLKNDPTKKELEGIGYNPGLEDDFNATINNVCQMSSMQVEQLKMQLMTNKLFLNMVIHDMRNPTNSIIQGLSHTLGRLFELEGLCTQFVKIDSPTSLPSGFKSLSPVVRQTQVSEDFLGLPEIEEKKECESVSSAVVGASLSQALAQITSNLVEGQREVSKNQMELNRLIGSTARNAHSPAYSLKSAVDDFEEQIFMTSFGLSDINDSSEILEHPGPFNLMQQYSSPIMSSRFQREYMSHRHIQKHKSTMNRDKQDDLFLRMKDLLVEAGVTEKDPPSARSTYPPDPRLKALDQVLNLFFELDVHKDDHRQRIKRIIECIGRETGVSHQADACTQTEPYLEEIEHRLEETGKQGDQFRLLAETQNCHFKSSFLTIQQQFRSVSERCTELQTAYNQALEKLKQEEEKNGRAFTQAASITGEAQRMLKKQVFSQQMMENLVNDLLDLAKLENNQFSLSKEYFNLTSTIFEAFQVLLHSSEEQKVELQAVIDKRSNLNLIQAVLGDKRRYMQILLNFLSNALKFTNKGGQITVFIQIMDHQLVVRPSKYLEEVKTLKKQRIDSAKVKLTDIINNKNAFGSIMKQREIHGIDKIAEKFADESSSTKEDVEIADGQERYVQLQLSVVDTGIGISQQGIDNLFINFSRLQENQQRNRQGTGLGLSICKKIIEQMGGSVSVRSELHKGTEFIINIKTRCRVKHSQAIASLDEEEYGVSWQPLKTQATTLQRSRNLQDDSQLLVSSSNISHEGVPPEKAFKEILFSDVDRPKKFQFISKSNDHPELTSCIQQIIDKQLSKQLKKSGGEDMFPWKSREHLKKRMSLQVDSSQRSVGLLQQSDASSNISPQNQSQASHRKAAGQKMNRFKIKMVPGWRSQKYLSDEHLNLEVPGIEKNSNNTPRAQSQKTEDQEESQEKFRCLVANDDPMQLYIIKLLLEAQDFEVSATQNGFEAFETLKKSFGPDKKPFDLVVLDLNMPISDGYETATNISKFCQETTLFHGNNKPKRDNSLDSSSSEKSEVGLSRSDLKPLLVALSGFIDAEIIKKAKLSGFELVYVSPLTSTLIKNEINDKLQLRRFQIQEKKRFIQMVQARGNMPSQRDAFSNTIRHRQNSIFQSSFNERVQRRSNSINPEFYLRRPSMQMHLLELHTAHGNLNRKSLRLRPQMYSYNNKARMNSVVSIDTAFLDTGFTPRSEIPSEPHSASARRSSIAPSVPRLSNRKMSIGQDLKPPIGYLALQDQLSRESWKKPPQEFKKASSTFKPKEPPRQLSSASSFAQYRIQKNNPSVSNDQLLSSESDKPVIGGEFKSEDVSMKRPSLGISIDPTSKSLAQFQKGLLEIAKEDQESVSNSSLRSKVFEDVTSEEIRGEFKLSPRKQGLQSYNFATIPEARSPQEEDESRTSRFDFQNNVFKPSGKK